MSSSSSLSSSSSSDHHHSNILCHVTFHPSTQKSPPKLFQISSTDTFSSLKYAISDLLTVEPEDLELYSIDDDDASPPIPDETPISNFVIIDHHSNINILCKMRTFSFNRAADPFPLVVSLDDARQTCYPEMEFILDSMHTVGDLKAFIGEIVASFHSHRMILKFEGRVLANDSQLICDALKGGSSQESSQENSQVNSKDAHSDSQVNSDVSLSTSKPVIRLTLVDEVSQGLARIKIIPLDASPQWISFPRGQSLLQFKRKIASLYPDYPVSSQRIIHAGYAVLDNEKPLSQTSITDKSEVHVVKSSPPPPPPVPHSTTTATATIPAPFNPPAGLMIGTINIDVPVQGEGGTGAAIDPSNIQSIMANVARSLTESLLPQIRNISSNPSAQSELDQGSLFRIEVDSIEGEYREFLQLLGKSPSSSLASAGIASHLEKLGVILRELSQNSPLLYQRLESMSLSAQANENYSFPSRSGESREASSVQQQQQEDTEHLIKIISKYLKLFESILTVCKAFKFENGRVSFEFPTSSRTASSSVTQPPPPPLVRMSTPQIYTFTSPPQPSTESSLVAGGRFGEVFLHFFKRLPPHLRSQSFKAFIGADVAIHPILSVFFDSFCISDLISFLSNANNDNISFKETLIPISRLFKRCFLRQRPQSSLNDDDALLNEEAEFLWDFICSSSCMIQNDDDESEGLQAAFKANFFNFFHSIVQLVFKYSSRLEESQQQQQQQQETSVNHQEMIKREFSQEFSRLLRSIGRVIEAFGKSHSQFARFMINNMLSRCDWCKKLVGDYVLASWIGIDNAVVRVRQQDSERHTVGVDGGGSENKRRRVDDLVVVVAEENEKLRMNEQLEAFIEVSTDGYFDFFKQ